MKIRCAGKSDLETLSTYDKHIRETELESVISLGRVIVAENSGTIVGWLRWNLFWDNTPFMNMLFLIEEYRKNGYGKAIVSYWEKMMRKEGYKLVMTSSLSNETAQHFYRKLNYVDSGALLLQGESLEIIFTKKIQDTVIDKDFQDTVLEEKDYNKHDI